MISPLVIVGQTSSGKTSFSLWLANELKEGADILVVDSKQVYIGQDVVTGKDIPEGFKRQSLRQKNGGEITYFTDGKTRVFGIDLVEPNADWSVANFLSYASLVRDLSARENRQLIIVGGTPLYTLSLFNAPETAAFGPDQALREELGTSSVEELQNRLKKLNPRRFRQMNPSDQRNPRRLIRAIEIEIGRNLRDGWIPTKKMRSPLFVSIFSKDEVEWIGLQVDKEDLELRIQDRVVSRIQDGAVEEYKRLQEHYPDWKPEAKLALGYYDIERYLEGSTTEEELVSLWTTHEMQYAKRQLTWWKREKQITWIDPKDTRLKEQVLLKLKVGTISEE